MGTAWWTQTSKKSECTLATISFIFFELQPKIYRAYLSRPVTFFSEEKSCARDVGGTVPGPNPCEYNFQTRSIGSAMMGGGAGLHVRFLESKNVSAV